MARSVKILVVVVTYNPDITLLRETVAFLSKQVDSILLYDNNSRNFKDFANTPFPQNVIVHSCPENKGLPVHYNDAIRYGQENGFDYLLILDQDSSFDNTFLTAFKQNISDDSVCLVPLLVHNNRHYDDFYPTKTDGTIEPVSRSINSGTLLNLKVLPSHIRFDEGLFIDCVDFDFFEKIHKFGLKVLRVNTAKLHISLGSISRLGPFFLYNYSPFRLEKQTRDRIIFIRKHPFSSFTVWLVAFTFFCNVKAVLFEKDHIKKFKAVIKGFVQGLTAKKPRPLVPHDR